MSNANKINTLLRTFLAAQAQSGVKTTPAMDVSLYQLQKELSQEAEALPENLNSLVGKKFTVDGVVMSVSIVDNPIIQKGNAYAGRKVTLHLST